MVLFRPNIFDQIYNQQQQQQNNSNNYENKWHQYLCKKENTFSPQLNVFETNEQVLVEAELVGIPKEDISLEIKDNQLIISGEKKRINHKKDDTITSTSSSTETVTPMDTNDTKSTTPGDKNNKQVNEKIRNDLDDEEFTTIGDDDKPTLEEYDKEEQEQQQPQQDNSIKVNHIDESIKETTKDKKEQEQKEEYLYHSRERRFGSFKRVLDLSKLHSLDLSNIKANHSNGLLSITIPKNTKLNNIKINIE